ncbi:MAG: [protein-PII] uridylyltransferase [Dongiaceae bacterium]
MTEILRQRDIIDRRGLEAALRASLTAGHEGADAQARLSGLLRDALQTGRAEIRRRYEADRHVPDAGRDVGHATSFLIDQLIRTLYDVTTSLVYPIGNPSSSEKISVVAVGGYGRGELAPFSDIDLLFLIPYKETPHSEQVIEFILYRLWDLGLKVGHAVRSIEECLRQAKGDLTIRTALLEARYLWGDQDLFDRFHKRYRKEIVSGQGEAFYHAKLEERRKRHQRFGISRYALEPNIKEGKGSLRDLQTLRWIARFLYDGASTEAMVEHGLLSKTDAAKFDKAERFFWTLRCQLHYLRSRPEEKLNFDIQPEIARLLGYRDHAGTSGVERLMKHYFLMAKSVGALTRSFCAAVEAQNVRKPLLRLPAGMAAIGLRRRELDGFGLEGGSLTVPKAKHFQQHPMDILRIFAVAQRHDVDIHPLAYNWLSQSVRLIDRKLRDDPQANALFMEILLSRKGPEATLRRMNEAGVFGRLIPDFGRIVAQMQFDMYHHYTVDEHTIFAIGILHQVESGTLKDEMPVASAVVHQVLSRRVLYLAVLLHDIAKGRGGDHSLLGAEVAEQLCPRLGFSAEETETVAWLVRYHLLMSNTAFKRDIDDPKTIADFADQVQSIERLRLLLVLTVCDIRAVGPKTWNGWKGQLLRELYNRTEEQLSGGLITVGREARVAAVLKDLRAALTDWPAEAVDDHLARGHGGYWLAFPVPILARQARLIRDAEMEQRPLSIDYHVDQWQSMTEVTVYAADRKGLVSQLAGAFALSGASIVDARIFTLSNGMVLDSFTIQDSEGGPFDQPSRLARLSTTIGRMLDAPQLVQAEVQKLPRLANPAMAAFPVAPRVLIDNKASATHTLIEVNGRDRRGLVYHLTAALTALNLQISNAKISTFGHRAIDSFYVKDQFGLKIEAESRLKAIREALMAVLHDGESATPPVTDMLAANRKLA